VRILVLGATGFIGSAVSACLAAAGHEVIGISRRPPQSGLGTVSYVPFDISRAARPESWEPLLAGIEAVVNCAGTLQDAPGESTAGVHSIGISALFAACEKSGVRRVIHLSATGVEWEASAFSKSKHAGEAALLARDLDWIALRPSIVIGPSAYGGSALFRGLDANAHARLRQRGGLPRHTAPRRLSPAVLAVVCLWLSCFRGRPGDILADDREAIDSHRPLTGAA